MTRGRFLSAPSPQGTVWRPNKTARGWTRHYSSRRQYAPDAWLMLAVRGTFDPLIHGLGYRVRHQAHACPCCGQSVRRLILSDAGRLRLAQLRRLGR